MARYVIAIKSGMWHRTRMSELLGRVESIPDCRVVGGTAGRRTIIEASAPAAKEIQQALGAICYIEPEIQHFPQGSFLR